MAWVEDEVVDSGEPGLPTAGADLQPWTSRPSAWPLSTRTASSVR